MRLKTVVKISFLLVLVFMLTDCKREIKKLPRHAADESQIETAKTFINHYFESMARDTVYQFPANLSDEMLRNVTPGIMKEYHSEIITEYGLLQSAHFAEVWGSQEKETIQVLRFKGFFEKAHQEVEIRIHLNNNNMILGFEVRPWKDNLYQ